MNKHILAASVALFTVAAGASPGDDGCVGNCAPKGGSSGTGNTSASAAIDLDISTRSSSHAGAASQSSALVLGNLGGAGGGGGAGGNGGSATGGAAHAAGGNASSSSGGNTLAVGNVTTGPSTAAVGDVSTGSSQASISISNEGARAAYAPDVINTPTAPCRIAVGASVGWLGGALGFGSSVLDEGCQRRENARLLNNLGEKKAALLVLCNDPEVAAALGDGTCQRKEAP